ncbi:MAG TPA: hypothetical protein VMY42_13395 [Thermoguttaceae bacterium]|nr:hypothetical protein [Thermoguttaceae bacterium]
MATTTVEAPPRIAPRVEAVLGALRRRIRAYIWVQGLASAAAWVGVAFWISLAGDWFFEPSPAIRVAAVAIVGLVFIGILVKMIALRAFVRLSNSNMATLLERRFDQLDDSLLTAVVLTAPEHAAEKCDPRMLAHTCQEAAQRIGDVRLRNVFNPVPLRNSVLAAVLLSVSVGMFVHQFPDLIEKWVQRSLLFSAELYDRKAKLTVDGFDGGVVKVARGSDLTVVARAHTTYGGKTYELIPERAYIRYRVAGGGSHRQPMDHQGDAVYSYTFENISAEITFDVIGEVPMGRDAVESGLKIVVVENPTLEEKALLYNYPPYMHRNDPQYPETVSGPVRIPRGTEVTVLAEADKELVRVEIDARLVRFDDTDKQAPLLPQETIEGLDGGKRFRHVLQCMEEGVLQIRYRLFDTDGVSSRKPELLELEIVPDEPPQFTAVRLDGIEEAITAKAIIPVAGTLSDDYGIDEIWYQHVVRQKESEDEEAAGEPDVPEEPQEPVDAPPFAQSGDPKELALEQQAIALDVRDLGLQPGQLFTLCLKASDYYDLGEDPNVANETTSSSWTLEVVSEDDLRKMLEWRELMARQRFESIIEKMTETRRLLEIDFDAPPPADEAAAEETPSPEALRKLREGRESQVQLAVQNGNQIRGEVLGVADEFDHIFKQFVNNRVNTDLEQLSVRLQDDIANPLRKLGDEDLPELVKSLEEDLYPKLGDLEAGPPRCALAQDRADAILSEMQKILKRMLELQSFNEAVELLREIIKEQEELRELTKDRRNQKLLED